MFFALSAQAQTDQIFPPIGGDGGGHFDARCPLGQHLAGFDLRVGDDVDAIRPLCVTAYGPAEAGPLEPYSSQYGGNGGGGTVQLVCPKGTPIVTGMYVRWEGVDTEIVNNIHLFCGIASTTQEPSYVPVAKFDGPVVVVTGKFFSDGNDAEHCPTGLVAVGINGRSGRWLDAVGLICGVPKLTPKPNSIGKSTPGVTSIGRVKVPPPSPSDPPQSICEMARRARERNSPAAPNLEAQCRAAHAADPRPNRADRQDGGRRQDQNGGRHNDGAVISVEERLTALEQRVRQLEAEVETLKRGRRDQ